MQDSFPSIDRMSHRPSMCKISHRSMKNKVQNSQQDIGECSFLEQQAFELGDESESSFLGISSVSCVFKGLTISQSCQTWSLHQFFKQILSVFVSCGKNLRGRLQTLFQKKNSHLTAHGLISLLQIRLFPSKALADWTANLGLCLLPSPWPLLWGPLLGAFPEGLPLQSRSVSPRCHTNFTPSCPLGPGPNAWVINHFALATATQNECEASSTCQPF